MENEFSRIDLTCVGASIIPGNAGVLNIYPNELGPNQVCNLFGAAPGQAEVSGSDYMYAGYEYRKAEIWRNFGCVQVFRDSSDLSD